jgi:hypothetical protein
MRNSSEMGAFAEARYFGWEAFAADQEFPIKGHPLKPDRILGSPERAEPYLGGPLLLDRLSPVDFRVDAAGRRTADRAGRKGRGACGRRGRRERP